MIDYVEKYNVDLSKLSVDRETFNNEVEFYIAMGEDIIPYDDPRYDVKVEKLAVATTEAIYNPDSEYNQICKLHDEMIEKEGYGREFDEIGM